MGAHSIYIPHDCEPIDFLFTHITGIVVENSMAIVCDFGAWLRIIVYIICMFRAHRAYIHSKHVSIKYLDIHFWDKNTFIKCLAFS